MNAVNETVADQLAGVSARLRRTRRRQASSSPARADRSSPAPTSGSSSATSSAANWAGQGRSRKICRRSCSRSRTAGSRSSRASTASRSAAASSWRSPATTSSRRRTRASASPRPASASIPGLGGTQRTTRRVGTGLTKWLICTGQIISAEEALAIGLIDAVAPREELDAAVARFLAGPPAVERRPGPIPASHQTLAAFFDANDVETIRTRGAPPAATKRSSAPWRPWPPRRRLPSGLRPRSSTNGARVSLAEGLRMEVANVEKVFSTADALTGLLSIGKSRPEFAGKLAGPSM